MSPQSSWGCISQKRHTVVVSQVGGRNPRGGQLTEQRTEIKAPTDVGKLREEVAFKK